MTEEERWEPEAKPKRFPQRGAPTRFQLHFGVVGVGSIASAPARVWEGVGGVPPTSIPTRGGVWAAGGRLRTSRSSPPRPCPLPLWNTLCGRFPPARGAALAFIRGAAPVRARPAGLSPSAGIEEHSLNLRLS